MLEQKIRITKIFDGSIPFKVGDIIKMQENENLYIFSGDGIDKFRDYPDSILKPDPQGTLIVYAYYREPLDSTTWAFRRLSYVLAKNNCVEGFAKEVLFHFVFTED